MKCGNCNNEVADGQAFCPFCGQRMIPTKQLSACPSCGEIIPVGTAFCSKCGTAAAVQDLKCRKCGADIPEGTKFCPNCGTSSIHGKTATTAGSSSSGDIMGATPDQATYQWPLYCFKNKYADFNGRARRREYWFYALFLFLAFIVLSIIPFIGWLAAVVLSVASIVPGLAVAVRRLHDIGKSGWTLLLALIPIAGPIIVLVMLAQDGEVGTNIYGPNPKQS